MEGDVMKAIEKTSDSQIEIIVANLMAWRLTLLHGTSDRYPTSLVPADVLNRLREEAKRNLAERGEPEFLAVQIRGWDNPIAALSAGIQAEAERVYGEPIEPVAARPQLDSIIDAWSNRIGGDLIIILDRFEDFLLSHESDEALRAFASELARAINRLDLRVNFLISIGEDAFTKLDALKGQIPNIYANALRSKPTTPRLAA
jgi:hypothetical protein